MGIYTNLNNSDQLRYFFAQPFSSSHVGQKMFNSQMAYQFPYVKTNEELF